jgi:hypothetical protein
VEVQQQQMQTVADDDSGGQEDNDMRDWGADCDGEGQEQAVKDGRVSGVVMMAAVAEDGGGGQWRQRQTKTATDSNSMQDWAAVYKGDRQEQAASDGKETEWRWWLRRWKMAAVDKDGGGWQQWRGWTMTMATVDNNSSKRQQRWTMTACKIRWQTTRGEEESRWQTTTE